MNLLRNRRWCGHSLDEEGKCTNCIGDDPSGGVIAEAKGNVTEENEDQLLECADCGHLVSKRAETCPNCGAPLQEERQERQETNRTCGCVALAAAALLVAVIVGPCLSKPAQTVRPTNYTKQTVRHPQQLAKLIISEVDAEVDAKTDEQTITIEYSIDPWALTNGTAKLMFCGHVRDLVPQMFERFSESQTVRVNSWATFTDVRGHDSRAYAFKVRFSRSTGKTVNWENVALSNLPIVADGYWQHPGLDAK